MQSKTEIDEFELELRTEFLAEAAQLVAETEECFLSLEKTPGDAASLDKLFRLAHSIKGGAGAVGFDEMASFAHKLESLLLRIKKNELPTDHHTIDLMLRCSDYINHQITSLAAGATAPIDVSLTEELESCLEQGVEQHDIADGTVISSPEQEHAASSRQPIEVAAEQRDVRSGFEPDKASIPVSSRLVEESIRVRAPKIEKILNTVGELVILQTVIEQNRSVLPSRLLQSTVSNLGKLTREIQDASMSLRMVPVRPLFQKLQRVVRDISLQLRKHVDVTVSGLDLEIDKVLVDKLGDPLVHIIRNAVDHGIDSVEERLARGKPATGQLSIRAEQQGRTLVIEIKDDGRGLDAQQIIRKAVDRKIISSEQVLSPTEAYQLIFLPGFSTRTEVTDISGRGVGMDVVKHNVEELGGEIQIETLLGLGTLFRVVVPVSIGILDGMIVRCGRERYVIPLSNIAESVRPLKQDIYLFQGAVEMLSLRGETLALNHLTKLLGQKVAKTSAEGSIALVVREPHRAFAVLVDDVIGQQQVVVKKLGDELASIRGFTGGAILGDGRAALILDLRELTAERVEAS